MTRTREKIRALFLVALMVGSVFAMTIAFSGSAVAVTTNRAGGSWDTGDQTGNVGDTAVVFQGEEVDFLGGVVAADLTRTSGGDEGTALSNPIPEDETEGTYAESGTADGPGGNFEVTVDNPRITTFEVRNNNNADVNDGQLERDNSQAYVKVVYNFRIAEDIELSIEDSGGTEVSGEVVETTNPKNGGESAISNSFLPSGVTASSENLGDLDKVAFGLDPDEVSNGDYTFIVEGNGDLDFGEASQSTTVTITDEADAEIALSSESAEQGSTVDFTVSGTAEDTYHVVTVDPGNLRTGATPSNLFKNVGDTTDTGVDNSIPYAVVQIAGDGEAVGRIDTGELDTTTVPVRVHQATPSAIDSNGNLIGGSLSSPPVVVDEQDLEVEEVDVSIDNPTQYVVGQQTEVNGTAGPDVDTVALYARNNGDWQPINVQNSGGGATAHEVDVDGDGTWNVDDVVLSSISGRTTGGGNSIFDLAGTYRIGVVDAADAPAFNAPTPTIDTSNFNSFTSDSQSIVVADTQLEANFDFVNGQVSDTDRLVDVNGTALGQDTVYAVFIDERGNSASTSISVDDDGTFEQEEINLDGISLTGSALQQGRVTAHILSVGADGLWGDTGSGDGTNPATGLGVSGNSGDQFRSRLLSTTVDDTGSDDQIVTEAFQLTNSLTSVDRVYPEGNRQASTIESGETMVIEGTTNRYPDNAAITVEVLNQDDESVALTNTENWGPDGQWNVSVDTSDIDPGNYTIRADDGDATDRQSVSIVAERTTPTPEPTPTPTETPEPTPTETPEPTPTATPEPTPTATPEPTPTETMEPTPTEGGDGPGFGVVVAVLAMLAAALLAARRNA